jgi:transcriptional regulator NrdR family protein
MDCARCGSDAVKVLLSRRDTDVSRVRERYCQGCDHRWFSVEVELPVEAVEWIAGPRKVRRREGFRTVEFR